MDASLHEMLAVLLARDIADGEAAIVGTNSDVQVAACNLARLMHAPRMWWVSGPGGMVNPDLDYLLSTADRRNIASAEAWMDLPNMVDFIDWKIHFFDFAILSAMQVDQFGNINTAVVGPQKQPLLRGPGAVGLSALCGLSRRFNVVMTTHSRRTFVKRVDFICGAGFLDGGDSRTTAGLPQGGPRLVVSPLGMFDFDEDSKRMRVLSLHPGVELAQLVEDTGFKMVVTGTPQRTVLPTPQELHILRTRVDTTGILRRKAG